MLEERLDAALAAEDPRERAALAAEAGDQLAIHLAAEEDVFDPAIGAILDGEIGVADDHSALKQALADLIGLPADHAGYRTRLAALRRHAERHHADEEAHLLPQVRRLMDADRRETLGREILAYQKRMLRAGQPRCETVQRSRAPLVAAAALDPALGLAS